MFEHRAIFLSQDIRPHLYDKVWANTENILVELGVMKLTQGQTIVYGWYSLWVAIGKDVGGIEQLAMSKTANGATFAASPKHTLPERRLVEPLHGNGRDVAKTMLRDFVIGTTDEKLGLVYSDPKTKILLVVAHDIHLSNRV